MPTMRQQRSIVRSPQFYASFCSACVLNVIWFFLFFLQNSVVENILWFIAVKYTAFVYVFYVLTPRFLFSFSCERTYGQKKITFFKVLFIMFSYTF